jgi:hypothetical protein
MDIIALISKAQEIAGLAILILTGLIGICLMIPGDQPEKALQAVLDFIKKFSKK